MTDHEIVLTTIAGEMGPEVPAPSEEDWAVLASGQASPWLRARLMDEVLRDPDAADRLAELTDPGYREAIAEAGELLRQPLPTPAKTVFVGDGGARIQREVAIRLRPSLITLFCGVVSMVGGYIVGGSFFAMALALALVCFLLFIIDYLNTNPTVQMRKAEASGDVELADALKSQIRMIRGEKASGE